MLEKSGHRRQSSYMYGPLETHSKPTDIENEFRTRIVQLIVLERDPAKAIEELSTYYRVSTPLLRMGLPKGEKTALGCYVRKDKAIYLSSSDSLYDPYVVIHEFYHHLRSLSGQHRGTERHARDFALRFLRTFARSISKSEASQR